MGVANRVINILVLVVAIVSVIFSFLLFKKREQLVKGWEEMAKQTAASAKALDVNSGTAVGKEFSADKLSLKNSEALATVLPKLQAGVKQIVSQRDNLANTLSSVAATLEITDANPGALKAVSSSPAAQKQVLDAVRNVQNRNDEIVSSYAKAVGKIGIRTSAEKLKNGESDKVAKELSAKLNSINGKINAYNNSLNQIANALKARFDSSDAKYQGSLAGVLNVARKQRRDLEEQKGKINVFESKIKQLSAQINNKDQEVKEKIAAVDDMEKQLAQLKKQLNPDNNPELDDYYNGKKDFSKLYGKVEGKVREVDEQWGFIIIDIGSKYKVVQNFGRIKPVTVLDIPANKVMTVARNLKSGKPDFISKVMITKTEDGYSVANIIAPTKSKIQVGDDVIFSAEDIAALMKKPENTPAVVSKAEDASKKQEAPAKKKAEDDEEEE